MKNSVNHIFQILCVSLILEFAASWNPYDVLAIDRQSDIMTIKRAYKRLAKEWHPDKNQSPDAEEKFVEINKAYELLSDPERRTRYDRHGETEEKLNLNRQRAADPFSAFDQFAGAGGKFRFSFQRHGTMLYHSQTVTLRQYQNQLVPQSHTAPTLMLAFSEWCFRCVQVEPMWEALSKQLQNVGVGVATVHAERERELSRKLGVDTLPSVFLLVDGRPVRYQTPTLTLSAVTEFIRGRLGADLLPAVSEASLPDFLSGWADNRVRLLIYSKRAEPRLRYLTLAFKFRRSVAAGYIHTESPDSAALLAAYNVTRRTETLLVVRESARQPAARLSMDPLPFSSMVEMLKRNQYLSLPRLSSQHVLEALCPAEASVAKRRLCAVLVCSSGDTRPHLQASLRQFLERSTVTDNRLRYAYIYMDKQARFMEPLLKVTAPADPLGHLLLLWRRNDAQLQFEWSRSRWDMSAEAANRTGADLQQRLRELLHSQRQLEHAATVQDLVDEHAPHLLRRILSRLYRLWEAVLDKLHSDAVVPALSVMGTIVFLIAGGYLMAYLVRVEEESIQSRYRAEGRRPPSRSCDTPQLRVHEMRVETYNGLVRLLKPGCRTIVLLLDSDSKAGLSTRFHRIVWPYRKNKSLMFATLNLERALQWYRQLLIPSLPDNQQLNINPKNCIGTVLSINGYRKYFCMYHAKHAEAGGKSGVRRRRTAANGGQFLGFDSSDSNSDPETGFKKPPRGGASDEVLFEEHLLDGLSVWLERLFEGQTVRYHVKYWPDFIGK